MKFKLLNFKVPINLKKIYITFLFLIWYRKIVQRDAALTELGYQWTCKR